MGQVTVTIAGKLFRMACDDGQESHLEGLAQSVDRKIGELRNAFGEIGDQRLTVMAAISMADEAAELSRQLAAREGDLAALRSGQEEADAASGRQSAALAGVVAKLAERVDRITDLVEGRLQEE